MLAKLNFFVQSGNEYLWDRKTRFVLLDGIQSHTLVSDKGTKKSSAGEHYCSAGPMRAALPWSHTGELSHDGKSTLRYLKMLFFHQLPQLPLLEVYNQGISINGKQFSCEPAGVCFFGFHVELRITCKKWRYGIIFLLLFPTLPYTQECCSSYALRLILLPVLVLLLPLNFYFHSNYWWWQ